MSEISLTVRDATHALHARAHAGRVGYLVAALAADPETVAELDAALARFLPGDAPGFFAGWRAGVDDRPWDAGACVIDLAARLVVVESTYSAPGPRGEVVVAGHDGRDTVVPYHLADDWLFTRAAEGWEPLARDRRAARPAPLDARPVLYDRVCEFIAAAAGGGASAPDTHARWLTTPRDDLGGLAPRDVLLARHGHIDRDLQDRCEQWSAQQAAPPALSRDSAAYRFAGFGTHEIVVYYELVRELIHDSLDRGGALGPTAEADRLRAVRDDWLGWPDAADLHGRTPAEVIENERIRRPEAMGGAAAVVDHDCPLCQMTADDPGPVFWQLDGCNMDDEFAFSFHRTLEEWEAERRAWEESCRRSEARRAGDTPWRTSFVAPDTWDGPPAVAVLGLATRLAELVQDLADAGAGPAAGELNRHFGNFREVATGPGRGMAVAVAGRLGEALAAAAADHPALADKCDDLERHLWAVAYRCETTPPDDDP